MKNNLIKKFKKFNLIYHEHYIDKVGLFVKTVTNLETISTKLSTYSKAQRLALLMDRWISKTFSRSYNVKYVYFLVSNKRYSVISPRSQNEFIDILSNEVRRIVVKEVQEASLFVYLKKKSKSF